MVNVSAASDAKRPLSLTVVDTQSRGEHNAVSRTCWAAPQPYRIGDRGLRCDGFSGRFVRCKRDRCAVTHGPRSSASRNRRFREIGTVDSRSASPAQKSTNRPPYAGFRGSSTCERVAGSEPAPPSGRNQERRQLVRSLARPGRPRSAASGPRLLARLDSANAGWPRVLKSRLGGSLASVGGQTAGPQTEQCR
jgi:hypothetical protein